MLNIEYRNLDQLIVRSGERPTLIFVSGEWLGSTVLMRTILNQLEDIYSDSIDFFEIELHSQEEFSLSEFSRLPTIILVCKGNINSTLSGIIPKSKLKKEITQFLRETAKQKNSNSEEE